MPIILNQDDETTLFFVEKREKSQEFPIIFELASLDFSHRACYNQCSFILCKSSMRTNRIFPHTMQREPPRSPGCCKRLTVPGDPTTAECRGEPLPGMPVTA